jgi:hypothetical protein
MSLSAEQIVKRVDVLMSNRANWENYWQDIANIFMPRKAYITRPAVSGEHMDFSRVFDSTPIRALNTMASGFHSWLTNPASKWFALEMAERGLMDIKEVKVWLEDAAAEIFFTLNNANADETLQEFYIDSGGFGTGNIFIQEDIKTRVHFTELPIAEVFIEEDTRGRVIRLYRKFEYTVQQAWDLWGAKAGAEVVAKINVDKKKDDKVIYIHCIGPRDKRQEGKKDKMNMPFESKWVTYVKKETIAEGGYMEFPLACGRFNKRTGEVWGFSPAMDNLADAHMLNAMKKTLIRAAMKVVDPPFLLPDRGFILPLNMNPSGANYRKSRATSKGDFEILATKGDIPIGFEMIQDTREAINLGMFVRLFQAFGPDRGKMTATEVNARIREGMALLGPVVGRFQQEVLDPIIIRTFNILHRNLLLPPVPPILQGREFTVKYISPLARAQRETEVSAILRMLSTVGEMAAFVPNVIDKINPDKAVDIIAEVIGVTPQIINDDKETALIRQAKIEAAQAEAQANQIAQGAGAVRDIAAAEKDLQTAGK